MTGTPIIGRSARLYIGQTSGTPVGYGTNITMKAAAAIDKVYSMDSLTPAVIGAGSQTYTWTCDRLYTTDGSWLLKLISGTIFSMLFVPLGTGEGPPYTTQTGCVVLNYEISAGITGAVLQKVSGEAQIMTETIV